MINHKDILLNLQEDSNFLPDDLLIILGPTASGKTKLAVQLAKDLQGEIISADSRQVYKELNIGTGKDLSDYQDIPYHLIDILDPGEKYNIDMFLDDFHLAYKKIRSRGNRVIVCGGTGFYIQNLLQFKPYTQIPIDLELRDILENKSLVELQKIVSEETLLNSYKVDFFSKKRLIRAIEISCFFKDNPDFKLQDRKSYRYKAIGLNPDVQLRRDLISNRLEKRLEQGMIQEVQGLLNKGLSYEQLEYYGLEYKFISYYLKEMYTYEEFIKKLETEIHRYAKRQMTYFRKMERDGVDICWY